LDGYGWDPVAKGKRGSASAMRSRRHQSLPKKSISKGGKERKNYIGEENPRRREGSRHKTVYRATKTFIKEEMEREARNAEEAGSSCARKGGERVTSRSV